MSPVATPVAPDTPKPSIASSMSKRLSKGKFMVDCKSELLQEMPDEMDRQFKVLRWPDLNDLLQKLLHPRPSMRPSADEVLALLDRLILEIEFLTLVLSSVLLIFCSICCLLLQLYVLVIPPNSSHT